MNFALPLFPGGLCSTIARFVFAGARAVLLVGVVAAASCWLGLPLAADDMDDAAGDPPGTHQGRGNNILNQLNNDADPSAVIPAIIDYVQYYLESGYGDVGVSRFDEATQPPGIFGDAYQAWLARQRQRIRDLLRACDPRGTEEALDYLQFHEVGYGNVVAQSLEDQVRKSEEFGGAFQRWEWRDEARRRLREGDGGADLALGAVGGLIDTMGDENASIDARQQAAGRLSTAPAAGLTLAQLRAWLQHTDSLVRFWVALMLDRRGSVVDGSAEADIVAGLQDHSWPMRFQCATILARAGKSAGTTELAALEAQRHEVIDRWPIRRTGSVVAAIFASIQGGIAIDYSQILDNTRYPSAGPVLQLDVGRATTRGGYTYTIYQLHRLCRTAKLDSGGRHERNAGKLAWVLNLEPCGRGIIAQRSGQRRIFGDALGDHGATLHAVYPGDSGGDLTMLDGASGAAGGRLHARGADLTQEQGKAIPTCP